MSYYSSSNFFNNSCRSYSYITSPLHQKPSISSRNFETNRSYSNLGAISSSSSPSYYSLYYPVNGKNGSSYPTSSYSPRSSLSSSLRPRSSTFMDATRMRVDTTNVGDTEIKLTTVNSMFKYTVYA